MGGQWDGATVGDPVTDDGQEAGTVTDHAGRAYLYLRAVVTAMTGDDTPVEHCAVDESVDLRMALAAARVEYLDVDDQRTIVIYQHAILMVTATVGEATAAREFVVELWEAPTGRLGSRSGRPPHSIPR